MVSSKDSQRSRFTIPAEYDDFDLLEYSIESGSNDDPEKILELRDMKDKIREIIETKYEDGNDKKTLLLKYFSSQPILQIIHSIILSLWFPVRIVRGLDLRFQLSMMISIF